MGIALAASCRAAFETDPTLPPLKYPMPSPHKHQTPYERCAIPGCNVVPTSFSRWCSKHTQRQQSTGHPELLGLRPVDLERHRPAIAQALADLASAPAVLAANAEAARLLNFKATHGAPKAALAWQAHTKRLRDWWTTPTEVVQRVCEVFYLDQDDYFPDRRVCEYALARMTLRLRKLWGMKMGSPVLAYGGERLHDSFALFAMKLRRQTDKRMEESRDRREAMRNGWPERVP